MNTILNDNAILKRLQGNKSYKGKKVDAFYLKTFFKAYPVNLL